MIPISKPLVASLTVFFSAAVTSAAPTTQPAPTLLSVERIWDAAPHSAFTDLIRYKDKWVCAFREADKHVGGERNQSRIRVLVSDDAKTWQNAGALDDPRGDIRDAKLAVLPDGRLMMLTCTALYEPGEGPSHQSIVFYSDDAKAWTKPHDVGPKGIWLWGVQVRDGIGYSIGYGTGKVVGRSAQLFATRDNGQTFEPVGSQFDIPAKFPNESAITFDADGTMRVLLRCEPERALIGTGKPPYDKLAWTPASARVGGPELLRLPDGRLLGGGRLYDKPVRTSLFWVDEKTGALDEALTFPSAGDTSYPGFVLRDGILYVSYYSQHQDKKCCIYLARVQLPPAKAETAAAR